MELREKVASSFLEPLGYFGKTMGDAERIWVGNNIDDAETGSLAYLCRSLADKALNTPEIREALSLKHSLETALRVNGSFHVTDETIAASGNSWK